MTHIFRDKQEIKNGHTNVVYVDDLQYVDVVTHIRVIGLGIYATVYGAYIFQSIKTKSRNQGSTSLQTKRDSTTTLLSSMQFVHKQI